MGWRFLGTLGTLGRLGHQTARRRAGAMVVYRGRTTRGTRYTWRGVPRGMRKVSLRVLS